MERQLKSKFATIFVLFHREAYQQIKEAQTVYLNAEDKALASVTGDIRLGKIVLCHSAEIFQPGHPVPQSHEGDSKKKAECASKVRNEVLPAV